MTFQSVFQNPVTIFIHSYIVIIMVHSMTAYKNNDMHANGLLNIYGASEIPLISI